MPDGLIIFGLAVIILAAPLAMLAWLLKKVGLDIPWDFVVLVAAVFVLFWSITP